MIKIYHKISDYKEITANTDGGCEPSNPGGVCCSAWVIYSNDVILAESYEVVQDGGELATNNFAEYKALELLLKWLLQNNWNGNLEIRSDSQLVVNQVNENWKMKAMHLKPLKESVQNYINLISGNVNLIWVKRTENVYADNLCGKCYKDYISKVK